MAPASLPHSPSAQLYIESEKPFYSVSDSDVLKSHCSRRLPYSDQEMSDWLESQAQHNPRKLNANIYGIDLINESPYLIQLLEALLTNQKWTGEPQKTYSSNCTSVDCAAREIFGEKEGIQLLFMLGRFGFNGSHLRVKTADPWKSQELDSVLLSLSDLPKHLISDTPLAFNHQLTHYKRGSDPSKPDASQPIANAIIFVFDNWGLQTADAQRYTVFHELGHDAGFNLDLDFSPAWYQSAGWTDADLEWKLTHPEKSISKYAQTNPSEDFAESFAAYRYNPLTLKKLNPRVYQFMKKNVFHDIEYMNDSACKPNEL